MKKRSDQIWTAAVVVALLAVIGYGGYRFYLTVGDLKNTRAELATTTALLIEEEGENKILRETLETEQYKNTLFEGQIKELAGTIGTLDKLSKTDKELLQKYSKVYFLNEHYVPGELATITSEFIYQKDRPQQIHAKVWPYLERMLKDAKKAGGGTTELQIISGYRSFGEQSVLKGAYKFTYGTGANTFSADQGYSEHQLGTAVDFTSKDLGAGYTAFKKDSAYKWLVDNAYKYGFTLSYPEGNNYYVFEPWHWRFVGTALATRLHEDGTYFYDLTQRNIDSYLISIFD